MFLNIHVFKTSFSQKVSALNFIIMNQFEPICLEIEEIISRWTLRLLVLNEEEITKKRNVQNRNIKQILGHMIDSASNNTHRTIHMQYGENPLSFPNYATNGNNDKWIAIQNYSNEDWETLVKLWKYSNLHIVHLFRNIDISKIENQWHCSDTELVSMKDCIIDYLRHLNLHIKEIEELL